jgi:hypothetical protein
VRAATTSLTGAGEGADTVSGADDEDPTSSDLDLQVHDLRATTARQWWYASALTGPRLSRRERMLRVGGIVATVCLALALVFAGQQLASPHTRTAAQAGTSSLYAQHAGVTCLADAAWSPDSARLATIGYQGGCATGDYRTGILSVYQADTGELTSWFVPDGPILRTLTGASDGALPPPHRNDATRASAIAAHATGAKAPLIIYHHLLWLPGGSRLALTYTLFSFAQSDARAALRYDGVLVVAPSGADPYASQQPVPLLAPFSLRWDLARGTPLAGTVSVPPDASPAVAVDVTWPLSPGYQWQQDGSLLPTASPSDTAIGNPAGGWTFSPWQPGLVELTTPPGSTAGIYTWNTTFAAVSPDGHDLVDGIGLAGRMVPRGSPVPDAAQLAALGASDLPVVTVRDAALARVLAALPNATADPTAQVVAAAWRPDGRVLAVYSGTTGAPAALAVTFYASDSGRLLGTLTPASADPSSLSQQTLLRWSPDGAHLLLASAPLGSVTLWRIGLPGA